MTNERNDRPVNAPSYFLTRPAGQWRDALRGKRATEAPPITPTDGDARR
jgi:hypothetical protein